MNAYDAEVAPLPSAWLAMPDNEKVRLVLSYHVRMKVRGPRLKFHSQLHCAIEEQLATGYGPTKRAVARLVARGLPRHEAIHVIGAILAQLNFDQARIGAAIDEVN